jgi:uncharacterized cupin superfamily protein
VITFKYILINPCTYIILLTWQSTLAGRGITGPTFPGCPETYQQQFQQSEQDQQLEGQSQSHKFRDEHQKIHRFQQGDVVALPAGVAHWCYNDGDAPIVAIYVTDIYNSANQLDPRHRVIHRILSIVITLSIPIIYLIYWATLF